MGTEDYTAPEMIINKPYSIKADIWSLGCVIYSLCAYRAPFEEAGIDVREKLRRIIEEKPPRIPDMYTDGLNNILM